MFKICYSAVPWLPRVAVVMFAAGLAAAAAGMASAENSSECPNRGVPGSCTWAKQGAYTWEIPTGATSVTFELKGAQGGSVGRPLAPGGTGGLGGSSTVTLEKPFDFKKLQITVGGQGKWVDLGQDSGGYNGGGEAGANRAVGAGGGGASDIRHGDFSVDKRLFVAGGGGGASWKGNGGAGGGVVGEAGEQKNQGAGHGAYQNAAGVGGGGFWCRGWDGELLKGGSGNGCFFGGSGAGGGGGGYFGGGGGADGSGGGGSGYIAELDRAKDAQMVPGQQQGDGQVTISWK